MKRYASLFALGLLLVVPAMADEASRTHASQIARESAATLAYKVPEDWKFIAVSESEWDRLTKQFHSASVTAFSMNQAHLTFLRESYVLTAKPERLRETLAHEFGHVVCACSDEQRANHEAQSLLQSPH